MMCGSYDLKYLQLHKSIFNTLNLVRHLGIDARHTYAHSTSSRNQTTLYVTVHTFTSCTSLSDACQCQVVQTPVDNMLK